MAVQVEATGYGYRSVVGEFDGARGVADWLAAVEQVLGERTSFCQLIDMRAHDRVPGAGQDPELSDAIQDAMARLKARGLLRSTLVVSTRRVALDIKQLAFASAIYAWERYLDGSDPGWEQAALDWLERGVDPDIRVVPGSTGFQVEVRPWRLSAW